MKHASIFFIPRRAPTLNELLYLKGSTPHEYNKLKKRYQRTVAQVLAQHDVPTYKSANFAYTFMETDRRRDPSNFIAGGIKFIEDALVAECVITNDGWQHVRGILPTWQLSTSGIPGVVVCITGEREDESRSAIKARRAKEKAEKTVERAKSARAGAVGLKKHPKPVGKARRPRSKAKGAAISARRGGKGRTGPT